MLSLDPTTPASAPPASVALEGILSSLSGIVPCPATDASITLEFNAVVADGSVTGAESGSSYAISLPNSITYTVPDLENNPNNFEALLDYCSSTPGTDIVVSASYSDNEGNTPDLSALHGVVPTCDDPGMQFLAGERERRNNERFFC